MATLGAARPNGAQGPPKGCVCSCLLLPACPHACGPHCRRVHADAGAARSRFSPLVQPLSACRMSALTLLLTPRHTHTPCTTARFGARASSAVDGVDGGAERVLGQNGSGANGGGHAHLRVEVRRRGCWAACVAYCIHTQLCCWCPALQAAQVHARTGQTACARALCTPIKGV